jgi:hypothetical protein
MPSTDIGVARFIADHERGLIGVGDAVDAAQLIAGIIKSFPNATFALPVPSVQKRDDLVSSLAKHGINLAERRTSCGDEVVHVVVGLQMDFADPDADYEKRDIVLFPEVLTVFHERSRNLFVSPDARFRVFGLMRTGTSLSPGERDILAGAFGFAEIRVPRHGYVEVPPRIAWVDMRSVVRWESVGPSDIRSVWRSDARNLAIAQWARAADRTTRTSPGTVPSEVRPRVIVLTAAVEHARQVHKYLHGWKLFTDTDECGVFADWDSALAAGGAVRAVATIAGLEKLPPHPGTQIVLWAGSGPAAPPIPRAHSIVPQTLDGPPLPRTILVDFTDRNVPLLRRWARSRCQAYRRAGFLELGVDEITARARNWIDEKEMTR